MVDPPRSGTGVGASHRMWRRVAPGVIAGGYALVGLLWIVTSDLLVAAFVDDVDTVTVSLVKGVGYVALTGGLLYFVLVRRERWLSAARAELGRWVQETRPIPTSDVLRVLLIDGDDAGRAHLRGALASNVAPTFRVDEATNVSDARIALRERIHDVILIDQRLGGGAGLDLVREFSPVASGPMIVVAGDEDQAIDLAAEEAGAHDYLLKHEITASWFGRTLRYAVANWHGQREVARTRRWYDEMVQEVPIGLFRSTPAGELREGNPALLHIFGAESLEQLQEVGVAGLYRDSASREDLIGRVLTDGRVEDIEVPMRRLDGTPIVCRVRMRAVGPGETRAVLYGAIIDVTAEHEAAQSIRDQASMLDQVKNAVIRTDLRGDVKYWNRSAETLFGWSAAEALGRPILDVTVGSADRAKSDEIIETLRTTGWWEGEYRCSRKDGTTFPALVAGGLLTDPVGKVTGAAAVIADLSDIRRAEEQVAIQKAMAASVLESVAFPAVVLDPDGTIVAFNGAWADNAEANGAPLSAVGLGVNYLEVCDASGVEDGKAAAVGIRSVLRRDLETCSYEYLCATRWFRMEVAPAVDPLAGAVVMHIDVTDLREAARQAEEFARSKDRLLASVSHELRTPLTAVLGFSGLLEETDLVKPGELASFVHEIHHQATDMAAIVEDLLVVARMEADALTVRLVDVDADAEVARVVENMPHDSAIRLEHVRGDVPPIRADPLRFRQVIRNLVTNALRYGGSHVRTDVAVDGDTVSIRVADNGSGVPADLVHRIFEPFVTAHDRRGQPDALGLGLSVVKTLSEAMGGTVRLMPEEGWTVFVVTFPVAAAPESLHRTGTVVE